MFSRKEKSSKSPVTISTSSGNGSGSSDGIKNGHQNDEPLRPMSPTSLSRLDEKNQLINLNNRLAVILDRNHQLEQENSKLNGQLSSAEQTLTLTTNKLKQTYEKENVDLRKKLDGLEKDKVRADLNAGNLGKDLAEIQGKLTARDRELSAANGKIKDLEKDLNNMSLNLKKLNEDSNKFEKQSKESNEESIKLKKELDELRKKLESEVLSKLSLESRAKAKDDELKLSKEIHEQEVAVITSRKNNELESVGKNLEKEYSNKLESAILELRNDCGRIIKESKLEQEKLYKMREGDMKKLLERANLNLKEKSEELSLIMKRLNEMEKKLLILDGEKHSLDNKVRDLEKKYDNDTNSLKKERDGLENELDLVAKEKLKLINEYQDLVEVKIGLDNELATYRKLLEGEEERLKIRLNNSPPSKSGKPSPPLPPQRTVIDKIQKEIEKQIQHSEEGK